MRRIATCLLVLALAGCGDANGNDIDDFFEWWSHILNQPPPPQELKQAPQSAPEATPEAREGDGSCVAP